MLISLANMDESQANELADQMLGMKGVVEVTLNFNDAVAYLKVDNQQLDKSQLQELLDQYGK